MTAGNASGAPWRVAGRHDPIPGESLDGLVARICALEHLPNTMEVTALAGVVYSHRPELGLSCWDGLGAVADCIRVDVAELQSRSHPPAGDGRRDFFGVAIDGLLLESYVRRFSPATLARSPHHRALWALRPFPFCDASWEFLAGKCHRPFCGAVQRWHHTHGIDLCDACGGTLVDTPVAPVPHELRARLRLAVGLVHTEPARRKESAEALPSGIGGLDTSDRFDLLIACARLCDPKIATSRHPVAAVPALQIATAVADGWSLIEGWPLSVEHLASARIGARPGRFGDGAGGATMAFLDAERHRSEPLRNVVRSLRASFQSAVSRCVELPQAARMTGLRVSDVAALRRDGSLPAVFTIRDARPRPMICGSAAARLAALLRESAPIIKVAARLGLPYHGVEQLLALGVLTGAIDPAPSQTRGPIRVEKASVAELEGTLRTMAAPCASGGGRSLPEVMAGIGGRLKPWGSVIQAMTEGKLRIDVTGGSGPLAKRVLVYEEDVRVAAQLSFDRRDHRFPFATHMSSRDALRELNLHCRHCKPLLNDWPSSTGSTRTVPIAAVEKIAASVATPAELGALLGVSSAAASRLMVTSGLQRVSPAGFDRSAALGLADCKNVAPLAAQAAAVRKSRRPARRPAGEGRRPSLPSEMQCRATSIGESGL